MWPILSHLPKAAALTSLVQRVVSKYWQAITTHALVAALAVWGTMRFAGEETAQKTVLEPDIPDIRIEKPDQVSVSRETTRVLDTTCALIPEEVLSQEKTQTKNGLLEVTYLTERPPYLTVEVTEQGPAVEVTPDAVTLQGYDPSGTLRSYSYERDRRRLSLGGYTQLIGHEGRLSAAIGGELRFRIRGRWTITGQLGKRVRPGWTGSLSLTYDLL